MERISLAVATVLGIGFIPWAPGTFGSIIGILPAILTKDLGLIAPLLLAVGCLMVIPPIARTGITLNCTDASAIVIDEVMGMWLSLLYLPLHWWSILSAFLLFRLFDIVKPFPVGWLDRRVPGAWGVMADDLAAGAMANIILQCVLRFTILHG